MSPRLDRDIRGGAASAAIADRVALERRLVEAKQLRYSVDYAQYYHGWYNELLLDLLDPRPGQRVLDCGCGTGVFLPALQRRAPGAVGLDLCLENLQVARRFAAGASLVVADIGALPLAPASLDHVVCRGVLHRLPDPAIGLRQLFVALKGGGDLVMSEPIGDSRALTLLRGAARAAGTHPFPEGRVHYPTAREWLAVAQGAGFCAVRWMRLGYLAFPLLGFPEAISLLRGVPGRMALAKTLVGLDRVLARVPYLNGWAWQAVFHFRKPIAAAQIPSAR